jgi:Protein of unknown function (DUF3667)
MTKCPACSKKLNQRFEFCPYCGEEINRHKFTFKHIASEIVEGFTHLDIKVLHYAKLLFTKPWFIIYEYLHGRKKKYFNPYVAFVLMASLFVLNCHYNNTFRNRIMEKMLMDSKPMLSAEQFAIDWKYCKEVKQKSEASLGINKYFHAANLFIYALPFWLLIFFFHKKSYNYIEVVFGFMVLWTSVFILYNIQRLIELPFLTKYQIPPNLDWPISGLISIFIGYQWYKILQLENQYVWIAVFALTFFAVDNTVIDVLVKWVLSFV